LKLYLDLCVHNRPFDNQHQERIALETNAFIYILEKVEKGEYELVASEALVYENSKNPDELRRLRLASYFCLAKDFIKTDCEDLEKGGYLVTLGFSAKLEERYKKSKMVLVSMFSSPSMHSIFSISSCSITKLNKGIIMT